MSVKFRHDREGVALADGVQLSNEMADTDGSWETIDGLRPISLVVDLGDLAGTVRIHVSNAETKPDNSASGVVFTPGPITEGFTALINQSFRHIKASITDYASGTLASVGIIAGGPRE